MLNWSEHGFPMDNPEPPKDGTPILVVDSYGSMRVARWGAHNYGWVDNSEVGFKPRRWMPAPTGAAVYKDVRCEKCYASNAADNAPQCEYRKGATCPHNANFDLLAAQREVIDKLNAYDQRVMDGVVMFEANRSKSVTIPMPCACSNSAQCTGGSATVLCRVHDLLRAEGSTISGLANACEQEEGA